MEQVQIIQARFSDLVAKNPTGMLSDPPTYVHAQILSPGDGSTDTDQYTEPRLSRKADLIVVLHYETGRWDFGACQLGIKSLNLGTPFKKLRQVLWLGCKMCFCGVLCDPSAVLRPKPLLR